MTVAEPHAITLVSASPCAESTQVRPSSRPHASRTPVVAEFGRMSVLGCVETAPAALEKTKRLQFELIRVSSMNGMPLAEAALRSDS